MIDFQSITLFALIFSVIELVAIGLAVDAIMRAQSPNAAIAWSISLVTFPFLTIPLYLVFGRSRFLGYSEAIREKLLLVEEPLTRWYQKMGSLESELEQGLQPISKLVRGLTGIPFTRGNRVTLLMDGKITYQSMFEAISKAQNFVFIQFYIVNNGKVSEQLKELLIKRAQEGIKIYFLYDEIGSWKLQQDYLDELAENSIAVSGFKTTQGKRNRFQINFRNHRKLLIVDGCIGFIGGHNLGDEYLEYRDTHIKIEGHGAQQIQLTFMKDWFWATRQLPEVKSEGPPEVSGESNVSVISTGPADSLSNCSALFLTLINSAQKRVWITSPYFVPDEVMVRCLQSAAIKGVDVRMIDCGVKLFRYQKKFLHQKVILIDDLLAGVGTVNLDNRSLYLNFEASALVAERSFIQEIEDMLQEDLEHSMEVCREHFDDKPFYFRVAARIAALASPLL